MKIAIYGFGTTPIFFKALIEHVSNNGEKVVWSAILPTSHHLNLMKNQLPTGQLVCIHEQLSAVMSEAFDLTPLMDYPGSIIRDIETEKITLKHRDSRRQIKTALATYKIIKRFMVENRPDYLLFAQPPEGMDGMILAGVAKECGVKLAVPHHTRNIGRTFFSDNAQEVLPQEIHHSPCSGKWARTFLSDFRARHINPAPKKNDQNDEIYPHAFPSRKDRTIGFFKRLISEPENREIGMLRVSLLNSWFPIFRNIYRGMRKNINKQIYNCGSTKDLPQKFIFYPLQYTPESSINVPAPYFIDQMRIIDAIRMEMPNNYQLVVKEHPACIYVRDSSFTKALLKKAGVVVANYELNTQEIILRAGLTISVTGTAAFEAFLYGKASIVMAPTFFSKLLGGHCGIDQLRKRIVDILDARISDEVILNGIQDIYSCSADFIGRSPEEANGAMMRTRNVTAFWQEFKSHIRRLESHDFT
jgi:hypothetical protein